jgi:hypothetical protein
MVIEVGVADAIPRGGGAVGACVSPHGLVEAVVWAFGERFPAPSVASMASVYVVPQVRPVNA